MTAKFAREFPLLEISTDENGSYRSPVLDGVKLDNVTGFRVEYDATTDHRMAMVELRMFVRLDLKIRVDPEHLSRLPVEE